MQPNENEDFDTRTGGSPVTSTVNDISQPTTPISVSSVGDSPSEPVAVPAPVSSTVPATPKAKSQFPKVPVLTALVVLLLLAVAGLGVYAQGLSSDKSKLAAQVSQLNANPQLAVQKQTDQLITNVGNLMTLPKDETPTVANVSDAAKAKQQSAFFNNAQNGDRVLMYVKAGEAILYRPGTNKIILVAPLTFNNSTAATSSSDTTATPTKK